MNIFLRVLCGMIVAALLTLGFMALVDVRSMIWPLLAYAFLTSWALLTIGLGYMGGTTEPSDTY